jgi:hypothetical protein
VGRCDLDLCVVEESQDIQGAGQRLDVLRERREVKVSLHEENANRGRRRNFFMFG